jgi:hypothetical protein
VKVTVLDKKGEEDLERSCTTSFTLKSCKG